MKTTANLLLCILTTFLASVIPTDLLADTPLPPPAKKEIWSPDKKFCAVMVPKPATTTVYRIDGEGERTKSWTMPGWFRVAHLANDGEHLAVGHDGINLLPLKVTKDEPMIRFFRKGKLLNTVTLGDLLKNQSSLKRTVSHYLWGSYLGLDEKGHYAVKTVEGRTLVFDVTTGKPAMPAEELMTRLPHPDYHRQPSDPEWLVQVVQFHGHLGPAVVAGARMGMAGLRAVEAKGYFDVEVTCEGPFAKPPQACFLDGLQVATGATLGKRTLQWVQAEQITVRIKNIRTGKTAVLRPTPALMELLVSFKSQPKVGAGHAAGQNEEQLETIARKIALMPERDVASVTMTEN